MRVVNSIDKLFLFSMISVAILSITISGILTISYEYQHFRHDSKALRKTYIDSQESTIRNEVVKVIDYIKYMKSKTKERLKDDIKGRTYEAYNIAMNIYTENMGHKNRPEIAKMIKDALRPVRFNNGRGYFFASDLEGIKQLNTDKPELEGKNLLDTEDAQGQYIVKDMIKIAKSRKEGFYNYTWTKPNVKGKDFPKITYIKYFEPLNWFIGTGEYLDDVESDIQKEILSRISKIRFGKKGYIFVVRFDGLALINDTQRHLTGKNIWGLTDPNGVKFIQESRKAVESPDGGFVHYVWNKPTEKNPAPKISFIQGFQEWEWMVGAGVYIDEIEAVIQGNRTLLKNEVRNQILIILLILALLLILISILARNISNRIKKSCQTFSDFFEKTATASIKIDPQEINFIEFKNLAFSANRMVDQRLQAEESLRHSNERFRSIFNQTFQSAGILALDGTLTAVNQTSLDFIGAREADVIGKPFWDTPWWHHSKKLTKWIRDAIPRAAQGEILQSEVTHVSVHGDLHYFDFSLKPVVDENCKAQYLIPESRDITDRKLVEEALQREKEKFRILVEEAPLGVSLINKDGCYEYINSKFVEIFGYTLEDIHTGRDWFIKAFPNREDRHQAISTWFNDQKNEVAEAARHRAFKVKCKDGSEKEINFSPVILKTRQWLVIYEDVTEKKQLEAHLQQSQKMEAIGTLAGGIAHDFNNILAGILGYTQLLQIKLQKSSDVLVYLDSILKAGNRAKDLVGQILTFSRRTAHEFNPIEVQPVIKEALNLIKSSLPSTISIRQKVQKDCGVVLADHTQIHQVIMNLCTNAYHAMEEKGGKLTVALKEIELTGEELKNETMNPGKYIQLTVADTGKGMDRGLIDRIFDPYFTTKKKGKGTGMGLAVTHGIVKSHGGYILVKSEPEKGTEFNIYLPSIGIATDTAEPAAHFPIIKGSERILLVDDQKEVLDIERQMLEVLGYQVTAETSSLDALDTFRADPGSFDLVITDMTMPNMTGDKLSAEMVKIRSDIHVLLCTGFSEQISKEKIESLGIEGLLMKPVAIDDLSSIIRKVLAGE